MPANRALAPTLLAVLVAACRSDPPAAEEDGESEASGDGDGDGDGDDGDGDGDGDGDSDGDGETGPCFDGLERFTWDPSATTVGYDLPAPDFTVETLRGPETFSEFWDGCDNHVFVIYS